MTKEIKIDFEFAKYHRGNVCSNAYYAHPDFVKGQYQVWHEMCITLCPGHKWEEIKDEDGKIVGMENCKVCGARDDWEVEAVWNKFKKTCDNCIHMEHSGGDIVPWGSTTVRTPEGISCMHHSFSDDTKEQEEEWFAWEEKYCSGHNEEPCPLWEGINKKEG